MKERYVNPCLRLTCSLPAYTWQSDHSTAIITKGLGRLSLGIVQKTESTMYLLVWLSLRVFPS